MEFDFHPVKPRKADFTDAGPSVSVTNTDVKFRDAEITIIHNVFVVIGQAMIVGKGGRND